MKKFFVLFISVFVLAGALCAAEASQECAYKNKMAVGFNVIDKSVDVRFWPKQSLGIDFTMQIGYDNDTTNFGAGAGVALPLYQGDGLSANYLAGANLGLSAYDKDNNGLTTFLVGLTTGVEFEAFLTPISKDLSLSSSVGMSAGIRMIGTKIGGVTTNENKFYFGLANSAAVNSLTVRYYF